jgi:hypothetical protein
MNQDPRTPVVTIDPPAVSHPGDGSAVELVLRVTNPTAAVEVYELQSFGVPPEWCHAPDSLVVDPGESVPIWITLTAEVTSQRQPGPYPITFSVSPLGAPDAARSVDLALNVEGTLSYEVRSELIKAAGRRGNFTLDVENNGERTINLAVSASDVEGRCRTQVEQRLEVLPHSVRQTQLRVSPKRSSLLGSAELFSLTVRFEPQGEAPRWIRTLDLEFEHRPLLGFRQAFVALFLLAVAGLSIVGMITGPRLVTNAATGIECRFIDDGYRTTVGGDDPDPLKKGECGGGAAPATVPTPANTPAADQPTPRASEAAASACTAHIAASAGTKVKVTSDTGLALRSDARADAPEVVKPGVANGATVEVIDGASRCDEPNKILYWKVRRADNVEGWVADGNATETWLQVVP